MILPPAATFFAYFRASSRIKARPSTHVILSEVWRAFRHTESKDPATARSHETADRRFNPNVPPRFTLILTTNYPIELTRL